MSVLVVDELAAMSIVRPLWLVKVTPVVVQVPTGVRFVGKDVKPPADFVSKARPSADPDYIPVFQSPPEPARPAMKTEELKAVKGDLDGVQKQHDTLRQGFAPAAKAMAGQDVSYDRVPYFFSDQYDLGMEYSGYVEPGGYEQVAFRGDVDGREFVAFWLGAGGHVLAGMNVNVWDVTDAIQALVRSGQPVDVDALRDPAVPLESLAGR